MIKKTVLTIIADQLNVSTSELSVGLSLFDDLNMDGDEFMTVVSLLEDEFDIVCDEETLEELDSIKDLIKFIEESV